MSVRGASGGSGIGDGGGHGIGPQGKQQYGAPSYGVSFRSVLIVVMVLAALIVGLIAFT
jgi:hypothetical protein